MLLRKGEGYIIIEDHIAKYEFNNGVIHIINDLIDHSKVYPLPVDKIKVIIPPVIIKPPIKNEEEIIIKPDPPNIIQKEIIEETVIDYIPPGEVGNFACEVREVKVIDWEYSELAHSDDIMTEKLFLTYQNHSALITTEEYAILIGLIASQIPFLNAFIQRKMVEYNNRSTQHRNIEELQIVINDILTNRKISVLLSHAGYHKLANIPYIDQMVCMTHTYTHLSSMKYDQKYTGSVQHYMENKAIICFNYVISAEKMIDVLRTTYYKVTGIRSESEVMNVCLGSQLWNVPILVKLFNTTPRSDRMINIINMTHSTPFSCNNTSWFAYVSITNDPIDYPMITEILVTDEFRIITLDDPPCIVKERPSGVSEVYPIENPDNAGTIDGYKLYNDILTGDYIIKPQLEYKVKIIRGNSLTLRLSYTELQSFCLSQTTELDDFDEARLIDQHLYKQAYLEWVTIRKSGLFILPLGYGIFSNDELMFYIDKVVNHNIKMEMYEQGPQVLLFINRENLTR